MLLSPLSTSPEDSPVSPSLVRTSSTEDGNSISVGHTPPPPGTMSPRLKARSRLGGTLDTSLRKACAEHVLGTSAASSHQQHHHSSNTSSSSTIYSSTSSSRAGATWGGADENVEPRPCTVTPMEQNRIDCILEGVLYVTSWRGASEESELKRLGISHIVVCCSQQGISIKRSLPVEELVIPIADSMDHDFLVHVNDICDFVRNAEKQHGTVLVHCNMGISRSATVAIAYLVKEKRMPLRQAFLLCHSRRRCIWPNDGFMAQLIELERKEHGEEHVSVSMNEFERWSFGAPIPPSRAAAVAAAIAAEGNGGGGGGGGGDVGCYY